MSADLVFIGGSVLTMDAANTVASAVAVKDGLITRVGSDEEIRELIGSGTNVVELNGRTMLPGINDSHVHNCAFGRSQLEIDCSYPRVTSIADIAGLIAEAVAEASPGEWIAGNGWDLGFLAECQADSQRMPTRFDLDAVAPNNPVFLQDFSGHLTWTNTKGLEVAQVGSEAVAPPGGVIYRDSTGVLTGLFAEGAQALIHEKLPEFTRDGIRDSIKQGIGLLHSQGITSWTEPGLGPGGEDIFQGAMGERVLDVYLDLARRGELLGRMGMLWMPCGMSGSSAEMAKNLANIAFPSDIDPRNFRLLGVKVFGDGIPPNKTAWMKEEYVGGGHGSLCVEGHSHVERALELTEMIRLAHTAGYQVGVHVTGDAAIDTAVRAFAAAVDSAPRDDTRHYIIHGDFVSADNLAMMSKYGFGLNMNPGIKWTIADLMDDMMGLERSAYQWPVRSAVQAGVSVSSSSDAPVTIPNWRQAVSAMMLRESKASGRVSGPDQTVDLTTALRAYTTAPARQDFAESWKGTVEVGKVADLCVVERDLLDTEAHEIANVNVDITVFDGSIVYSR